MGDCRLDVLILIPVFFFCCSSPQQQKQLRTMFLLVHLECNEEFFRRLQRQCSILPPEESILLRNFESMVELQLPQQQQQQQLPQLIPQLRTTGSHKSLCAFSQRLCVCSVPLHLPSSVCVRSAFFFFWLARHSQNAILKILKVL